DVKNIAHFQEALKTLRPPPAVVIVDPLNMCIEPRSNIQMTNMFDVAPILAGFNLACKRAGADLILVHHTTKDVTPGYLPCLNDIAFAGIAEFTRQWFLINHRVAFDPQTGTFKLVVSYGGSAGHTGSLGVDIYEGRMDEKFEGLEWKVRVYSTPAE